MRCASSQLCIQLQVWDPEVNSQHTWPLLVTADQLLLPGNVAIQIVDASRGAGRAPAALSDNCLNNPGGPLRGEYATLRKVCRFLACTAQQDSQQGTTCYLQKSVSTFGQALQVRKIRCRIRGGWVLHVESAPKHHPNTNKHKSSIYLLCRGFGPACPALLNAAGVEPNMVYQYTESLSRRTLSDFTKRKVQNDAMAKIRLT